MTNNIDFERFIIYWIELVRVLYEVYKIVLFHQENLRLQSYNNRKLQRNQLILMLFKKPGKRRKTSNLCVKPIFE